MKGLATATLVGNLTGDPEMKEIGDSQLAVFSVAINRKRKGEETVWFARCEAWGKLAEIVGQYCTKGSGIIVQARIDEDQWESKEGEKRSRPKFIVNDLVLAGGNAE